MPRRLLSAVSAQWKERASQKAAPYVFSVDDVVWAMGSFCALNRKPFDAGLLTKQFPPPYSADSFVHAGRALGFKIKRKECESGEIGHLRLSCLAVIIVQQAVVDAMDSMTAKSTRLATELPNQLKR